MKQMGSKHVHFDFHVFTPGTNHESSEDCWCEPTNSYWVTGANGKLLHVLEHNDALTNETPWVNRLLDCLGKD